VSHKAIVGHCFTVMTLTTSAIAQILYRMT